MHWVVVGGAGFTGSAICREVAARGDRVTVVDLALDDPEACGSFLRCDALVDEVSLPAGRIVLALGRSMPRPIRSWTLVLDNAMATARLAPSFAGRDVTLLSSIEVYGSADGPLTEGTAPRLPVSPAAIASWCDRAIVAAADPCPPHRVGELCAELADLDPAGRWVYAISKAAQEEIVRRAVPADRLTVLRCANVAGPGQYRLVGRVVEAFLDERACTVTDNERSFVSVQELARIVADMTAPGLFNVSSGTMSLVDVAQVVARELDRTPTIHVVPPPADDSCGVVDASRLRAARGGGEDVRAGLRRCVRDMAQQPHPLFPRSLPVVVPSRPERPHVVADRIAASLWSGSLRGGPWTARLDETVRAVTGCHDHGLVLTNSGTNALRLAVEAVAGVPAPGDVALCPAFTFHATAEVLRQLGYTVRLVDVDPATWTMDPAGLRRALADGPARVVVAVDALGNPCDYAALRSVCQHSGVPLVADSAAAIGAVHRGRPVGTQADAHAFSLSFAKVVSGGGSGGAAVLPPSHGGGSHRNWLRSAAITEVSAVVALDNMEALPELMARREQVAACYRAALCTPDLPFVTQAVRSGDRHGLVHWIMRVPSHVGRDRLAAGLAAEGIQTKPYYEPLAEFGVGPGRLPVTSALHREALALPMSSELSLDEAERVVAGVLRVLRTDAPDARRAAYAASSI